MVYVVNSKGGTFGIKVVRIFWVCLTFYFIVIKYRLTINK